MAAGKCHLELKRSETEEGEISEISGEMSLIQFNLYFVSTWHKLPPFAEEARWKTWIPGPSQCLRGQGLYDEGIHAYVDERTEGLAGLQLVGGEWRGELK